MMLPHKERKNFAFSSQSEEIGSLDHRLTLLFPQVIFPKGEKRKGSSLGLGLPGLCLWGTIPSRNLAHLKPLVLDSEQVYMTLRRRPSLGTETLVLHSWWL